jgi:acid phosphatase (class A)
MHPQVSPERLALARQDQAFSPWVEMKPVLGDQFTEARFPATARVMTDVLNGVFPVLNAAKNAYVRTRPYVIDHNVLQCDDPGPVNGISPSYPSAHAGMGWGWALALAELIPSKADAILERGYDFGQSRVICGFHYPSDVAAARIGASAVMARLHADPLFLRDMAAAKRELARAYH